MARHTLFRQETRWPGYQMGLRTTGDRLEKLAYQA